MEVEVKIPVLEVDGGNARHARDERQQLRVAGVTGQSQYVVLTIDGTAYTVIVEDLERAIYAATGGGSKRERDRLASLESRFAQLSDRLDDLGRR